MERTATTAQRLRQVMNSNNMKQSDVIVAAKPFCEKYGVKLNKSDLSQFVNGKVIPGQWKLTILGLALNVNETWLMGYDVPMDRDYGKQDEGSANIIPLPSTSQKPLIGKIACGLPITAIQNIEDYVAVPTDVKCDFALRCEGDSMIDARIYDGDIVYIRGQNDVENGEIAVVLIDGQGDSRATLKRVYKRDGQITLMPANVAYDPLVFVGDDTNRVRILGKAVAFTSWIQ